MKKTLSILLCLVMASALFAGCTPNEVEPSPEASPPAVTEPANTDENKVSTRGIWDAIFDEYSEKLPMFLEVDGEMLESYYGFDEGLLEDYTVNIPMMNIKATEFFIARVTDENYEAVKEGFDRRLADLDATWSSYLPDQYALVQDARIVRSGEYVLFCITKYADRVEEIFLDMTK